MKFLRIALLILGSCFFSALTGMALKDVGSIHYGFPALKVINHSSYEVVVDLDSRSRGKLTGYNKKPRSAIVGQGGSTSFVTYSDDSVRSGANWWYLNPALGYPGAKVRFTLWNIEHTEAFEFPAFPAENKETVFATYEYVRLSDGKDYIVEVSAHPGPVGDVTGWIMHFRFYDKPPDNDDEYKEEEDDTEYYYE